MSMFSIRKFFLVGCSTAFASGHMAAIDPMPVSVHPPKAMPAKIEKSVMPNVITGELVLEGTLVPAANPPATTTYAAMPLKTEPCVPVPEMKSCESRWFGVSLLSSGCDFCESPGRPSLFAGLFSKSCETSCAPKCETKTATCETCETSCSTPMFPRCGSAWEKLKAWVCYSPCDGPRVPWPRFEPYRSPSFTVMPSRPVPFGTCQTSGTCATGTCRPGLGLNIVANADGNCKTGLCIGGKKGMQDCNAAEPKLSNTSFGDGYRFAHIEPKTYGSQATRIDPIMNTVKAPKVTNDKPTMIEQASGFSPLRVPPAAPAPTVVVVPAPTPAPAVVPAPVSAPAWKGGWVLPKDNSKLSTPFSNP